MNIDPYHCRGWRWPTPRSAAVTLAALAMLAWSGPALSDGVQDATRVPQAATGTNSATGQTTPPAPQSSPAARAVIYVYRKGRMLGTLVRTAIFVNHKRLGELHNSNYVSTEVPAGPVEVIASGGYLG